MVTYLCGIERVILLLKLGVLQIFGVEDAPKVAVIGEVDET